MSETLIERLERHAKDEPNKTHPYYATDIIETYNATIAAQAKRIAELEAALQEIERGADGFQSYSGTYCSSIARAALATK